jgi:hypothetical protein
MKIYLSSTFIDLAKYRTYLGVVLRKAGYDVAMMEEYVSRDERVEFACMGDVVECDVYVGIFAWRYGYIPENSAEGISITEMEYNIAGTKPMTRLTFLLNEKARWPQTKKDTNPEKINHLRNKLKERCSAYFSNAEELAVEVLAALRVNESIQTAQQLEAAQVILNAQQLGPSYMMNIKEKLNLLTEAQFIELQIAPTPWWNTRLYLLASLAIEFNRTEGFVFMDEDGTLLLIAKPSEIVYRLETRWPALKDAYFNLRNSITHIEHLGEQLWRYPGVVSEAFGIPEDIAKHALTSHDLEYDLGIARVAEIVDVRGKGQNFLQMEILGRQTQFVALVRERKLEGIIDREKLAHRVAHTLLSKLI